MQCSYFSETKTLAGGQLMEDATVKPQQGDAGSASPPILSFVAARNLQLCDSALNTVDNPNNQTPKTFYLDVEADLTVTETITTMNNPTPTTQSNSTGVGDGFSIPYDYTSQTQQGTLTPTALPRGVYHSLFTLDQGMSTPSVAKNSIQYTLTTKQLDLKYSLAPIDNIMDISITRFNDYKEVGGSANLATNDSSWMLHGNNQVTVTVEGQDVSSSFATLRFMRVWTAPLASKKPVNGNKNSKPLSSGGWAVDTTGNGPSWLDVPGELLTAAPAKWSAERYLAEFVVTVDKFPEFGMLYFNVTCDTVPGSYRVAMTDAVKITANQWCTIKSSAAPFSASGSGVFDSGWKSAT